MRCGGMLSIVAALAALPRVTLAHWEVEVDPMPYFMNGYSAHAAWRAEDASLRVHAGVFAADVPQWVHGDEELELATRGVTIKLDRFVRGNDGLFVGIDADYSKLRYELEETGGTDRINVLGVGPRVGYRFDVNESLYVTPWVSVRYLFGVEDVVVDGRRFEQNRYSIFPTVHVGWRF